MIIARSLRVLSIVGGSLRSSCVPILRRVRRSGVCERRAQYMHNHNKTSSRNVLCVHISRTLCTHYAHTTRTLRAHFARITHAAQALKHSSNQHAVRT
jgi:hypothetical protein